MGVRDPWPGPGGLPPEQLDGSGAYLGALFEQSPIGIGIFDADLRYVAVNAALAQINGRPPDEHRGRRVVELLPDMDESVEALMSSVLETGEPLIGVLNRGRTPADPEREHVYEVAYYRVGGQAGSPLGVAAFVTDVTARQAAQDAFAAAQFRLSMVNEASARIGSTLDLDRTAREVVEVAVPRFADAVVVDVLESLLVPDASARDPANGASTYRLSIGSVDDALLDELPQQAGDPVRHPPGSPAAEALRTGVAQRNDAGEPDREGAVGPDGPASADRTLVAATGSAGGPVALIHAPLVARGHVLGVVGFARGPTSTPFDELDVSVAQQLAARAATAMDNARLYGRERSNALALQRALLPHDHPTLTGLEFAARYLPGGEATEIGGDWYDVVPLACGRVALVVGDVMGRGLRAAAAMGQLRTAVRTLAVLDLTPDDVVAQLDAVAHTIDGVQLATCVYAVYDPVGQTLAYASAGHLPPAVRSPDGQVELLQLPSGAPLAVGGVSFESAQVPVPDGAVVVLYTDGLVETREQDLDAGLDLLLRSLDGSASKLDELCDAVLDAMGMLDSTGRGASGGDDVALLVARLTGLPRERQRQWRVDPNLSAVAAARSLTARTLAEWGLEVHEPNAVLLVSELVTNAIRYARHPVTLRLSLLHDRLVGSVEDSDARLPRLRRAAADDEGGRGLYLVGTLARRWGTRPTAAGKVVWFELPVPVRVESAR